MPLEPIHVFWMGKLSPLEQLSVRSFLRMKHPVSVYSYEPLEGLPEGAVARDAEEIVPRETVKNFQNLANFSDFFRYSVLVKHGGYWADMDVCCLQPFMFPQPYVFATQLVVQRTNDEITTCVIKAPAGCDLLTWCLHRIATMDTRRNPWSALGPALLLEGHRRFHLQQYAKHHEVFCPLNYFEAPGNVFGRGTDQVQFNADTFAVHLWHEESKRKQLDKFARYPESLYERLQKEMGVSG